MSFLKKKSIFSKIFKMTGGLKLTYVRAVRNRRKSEAASAMTSDGEEGHFSSLYKVICPYF